eukprot:scaffold6880_cov110-Isochrysis_galbana.AAC.23
MQRATSAERRQTKRMGSGQVLFSPAVARRTSIDTPGIMKHPSLSSGAQITKTKDRKTKCSRHGSP